MNTQKNVSVKIQNLIRFNVIIIMDFGDNIITGTEIKKL